MYHRSTAYLIPCLDVVATAELVRSDAGKELEITLARVPTLADGTGGSLNISFIGGNDQVSIIVQYYRSMIDLKNSMHSHVDMGPGSNRPRQVFRG